MTNTVSNFNYGDFTVAEINGEQVERPNIQDPAAINILAMAVDFISATEMYDPIHSFELRENNILTSNQRSFDLTEIDVIDFGGSFLVRNGDSYPQYQHTISHIDLAEGMDVENHWK
jgi:hypothetical protein